MKILFPQSPADSHAGLFCKCLCLSFFFFLPIIGYGQFNIQKGSAQYQKSFEYLRDQKKQIKEILSRNNTHPAMLISVVFPEMLRFNQLQNYAESTALEVLYCNYGTKYADFSIGYFQMKPSFAENLEEYLKKNQFLAFQDLYNYTEEDPVHIRRERTKRLNDFEWQLKYLNAFGFALWFIHRDLHFSSLEEELKFTASAYNYDFRASTSEIFQWSQKKAFPYGKHYKGKEAQFSYAEVALEFYKEYARVLFE